MPKKKYPNKRYDIISIGDATLDHFMTLEDVKLDCSHNKKHDVCMLCINYADKIAVNTLHKVIGGNAANNAVGSSRLGFKSAIYTVLGDDDTGYAIHEMLKREKVSDEYVRHAKGQETNFSVVLNHESERTILVYHVDRDYKLPKLKPADWLYFTSIGKGHDVIHEPVRKYVKKNKIKMGFNPGTFQLKEGGDVLKYLIEVTEVLFVNVEEAKRIVGNHKDIKKLLRALHKMGAKIPVITDGPKGAFCFDGEKFWTIGTTPTEVIERTGAGDAFGTAVVAALMKGKNIQTALRWGTMNSASVIQFIGPQEGLLTEQKMKTWLRKFPDIKAKEF